MPRISRNCQIYLTTGFVIVGTATAGLSAGPVISYDPKAGGVDLVQKGEVEGKLNSQFVVEARGADAVAKFYGTVAGVLLQATARPDASLKSLPIKLSYRLKGDHEAVLRVSFGKQQANSEALAWVWAVAARFAKHNATGAVTLIDRPQSRTEQRFARRWHALNGRGKRLLWARYHPAVDDTLMGFFLLAADAVVGDPEQMRMLPNGLKGFERYSGYPQTFDRVKSARAARTLDSLISLKAKSGDCAMLNDVDETFVFAITSGRLQISGLPNYRFARKTQAGVYVEIDALTEIVRKNRRLLRDVNPLLNKTIADFAQLVAFFNYVGKTNPVELAAFVNKLKPVFDRIPTIQTPIALPLPARYGRVFGCYRPRLTGMPLSRPQNWSISSASKSSRWSVPIRLQKPLACPGPCRCQNLNAATGFG